MRKFFIALLAVLALTGLGWGWTEQRKLAAEGFDQRRLLVLEQENERLRGVIAAQEKTQAQTENIARRAAIEKSVAALRELPFLRPVVYDVLTRAGIKEVIRKKLDEQFSEIEFKNIALGLSALGLLPRDYSLKQKYIELLGEQVAAFYDQHQHKLFMFEDASLANAQNQIVLAHELTHALQDQHFGLLKMPLEIKNNDDRAEAASALVEGDATMLMSQFMVQNLSLRTLRDSLSGALSQNMQQLQNAPRYLREMLIFPYLRGQEFCAAAFARGGWPALDEVYKKPPSSTAQILHPEKYFSEPREEPIAIHFGDTTVNGEKPLADNVLGEIGTRILLSQWIDGTAAEHAAEGWRGDRYLVFDQGKAVVWKVVLADENKRQQFFNAVKESWEKRYQAKFVPAEKGMQANSVRFLKLIQDDADVADAPAIPGLGNGMNEVILLDAPNEKWAAALAAKFTN